MFTKFVSDCFENVDLKNTDVEAKKEKKDKITAVYDKVLSYDKLVLTTKAPKSFTVAYDYSLLDETNCNFKEAFKAENFKDYVVIKLKELLDWTLDNNLPVSSFPYIKEFYSKKLYESKVESCIKKDLDLYFYKIIYENLENKTELSYTVMPVLPADYIGKMPIDPSNKKTTKERVGNTFMYIHEINKHEKVKTIIEIPDADENTQPLKLFNLFDIDVIKAMIQLSDESFFTTRTVNCELGDIVSLVPYSKNQRIYKDVYTSIKKVNSFQSRYENSKTSEIKNYEVYKAEIEQKKVYGTEEQYAQPNLLNDTEPLLVTSQELSETYEMVKYQKLVVKAVFSEKFINGLIENAIFVDNEVSPSSMSNMAKALIIPLQNERYKLINENNYTVRLGFNSFFNAVLTLGTANKSRNLKEIEKALEEIKVNENIIKDFNRTKDFFNIEFLPLSKKQKDDLLEYIEHMTSIGTPLKLPFNPIMDI